MVHSTTIERNVDIETTLWRLGAIGLSLLGMAEGDDGGIHPEGDDLRGLAFIVQDTHRNLKALISKESEIQVLIGEAMERIPIGEKDWTMRTPKAIERLATMLLEIAKERRVQQKENQDNGRG